MKYYDSYKKNLESLYNSENYNILLYKSPKILNDLSLKMSKVDFKDCYEKVKTEYGITEDLITTVVDSYSLSISNTSANRWLCLCRRAQHREE